MTLDNVIKYLEGNLNPKKYSSNDVTEILSSIEEESETVKQRGMKLKKQICLLTLVGLGWGGG